MTDTNGFNVTHLIQSSPSGDTLGKRHKKWTLSSISSREARKVLHGNDRDSNRDTQQRAVACRVTEKVKVGGKLYNVITLDHVSSNEDIKRNCERLAKDEVINIQKDEFTVADTRESLACIEMRSMGINLNVFRGGEA